LKPSGVKVENNIKEVPENVQQDEVQRQNNRGCVCATPSLQ